VKTVFLRTLDATDKAAALLGAIRDPAATQDGRHFEVDPSSFSAVPRSPFAYWAGNNLLSVFVRVPAFQSEGRIAASGGKTLDDFRWIRAAWEIKPEWRKDWPGLAKGGGFSAHYADVHLLVDWRRNADALKAYLVNYRESRGWSPHWTAELHSSEHYFRPGLTWPIRTQSGLSARVMPKGCIFANKGPAMFVPNDNDESLLCLAAIVNSSTFRALVEMQMSFGSYEVGVMQRTPVPTLKPPDQVALAELVRRSWVLKRSLDACDETSHAFLLPALLQASGDGMSARVTAWSAVTDDITGELTAIEAEIDDRCFALYGISEADRRSIAEGFGKPDASTDAFDVDSDDDDAAADASATEDPNTLAAQLVSWAAGVAFSRFDVRLAMGGRSWPTEPHPFDPLPVCAPGVLAGDDGMPLVAAPADYPVPVSAVLVDDPGHHLDITSRVRSVFEAVFGDDADHWWSDAGEALGTRRGEVSGWLAKGFFDHHLKTYSRSRRKSPVFWPIGTRSGKYIVWLYGHRMSADSLFQVLHDVVAPKLNVETRELTQLRQDAGVNPTATQRKAIDAQEGLIGELRDFVNELTAVAPLWHPDLTDGIVVVLAPLWRLFAYHKPWSKELREHWHNLVDGEYDWARLAMRLWPERVVPKCAEDRSLAIAHGLEDVFWVQDDANSEKWRPRQTPTVAIEQLIAERTNPATKAALKDAIR